MVQKSYYSARRFKLYKADTMQLLPTLKAGTVDMIFADPPYFLSNGSFTCKSGKRASVKKGDWDLSHNLEHNMAFHRTWIKACRRLLKPSGTIWISGTYHSIYQCGFALQQAQFHLLNDIAWFKPNAAPNLSCRFFTASHETLLWARKTKPAKHTFNYKAMVEWDNDKEILHKKGKQMRSVWAIPTPAKTEKIYGRHPTQKPLELLKRIILASTNKGEVILDPFTGSSTTGLAAYALGRKFIGVDKYQRYLNLSIKRFEALKQSRTTRS